MALRNVLRVSGSLVRQPNVTRTISIIPSRSSSFRSSEAFESIDKHPEVEVIHNPPEWKYIEQLINSGVVPAPIFKAEYPSGWTPPDPEKYKKLPYFVERTRNHMVPVYLNIAFHGLRRHTLLKNIEGDIWKLEKDLHDLIEQRAKKRIYSRINEMNRRIVFKGDYVTLIQKHLVAIGL